MGRLRKLAKLNDGQGIEKALDFPMPFLFYIIIAVMPF